MRALVLGATGFLGGHIARSAHQAGMDVHGLRRRPTAVGTIGDLPIQWHTGDLFDRDSLIDVMRQCDIVYHTGAYYALHEHNGSKARRIAGQQMSIVLEAAREAGVARFVYNSSLTTIGKPPPGSNRLADERDFYVPDSANSAYFESKWVMEQEALLAAQNGLPIVVLVPCAAIGPGDVKPATSQMVQLVAQRLVPVAVDVTTNVVDGRDVAEANIRAATVAMPGERIIVGGHNMNAKDILKTIALIAEVAPPRITLPMRAAWRLLGIARMARLPVPDLLLGMDHFQPVNAERGWELFGITPRPFEETVRDTLNWFRANGYLKRK